MHRGPVILGLLALCTPLVVAVDEPIAELSTCTFDGVPLVPSFGPSASCATVPGTAMDVLFCKISEGLMCSLLRVSVGEGTIFCHDAWRVLVDRAYASNTPRAASVPLLTSGIGCRWDNFSHLELMDQILADDVCAQSLCASRRNTTLALLRQSLDTLRAARVMHGQLIARGSDDYIRFASETTVRLREVVCQADGIISRNSALKNMCDGLGEGARNNELEEWARKKVDEMGKQRGEPFLRAKAAGLVMWAIAVLCVLSGIYTFVCAVDASVLYISHVVRDMRAVAKHPHAAMAPVPEPTGGTPPDDMGEETATEEWVDAID